MPKRLVLPVVTVIINRAKKGTVRAMCLAHSAQCPRPGLEPEPPLDPESSALTMRPLRFLCSMKIDVEKLSNDDSYPKLSSKVTFLVWP